MSEDYSEVSSTSWFSRIIESIKGVAIGILLFFLSFPVLAWNEYNSVTTAESLAEGGKALVSVEADKVVESNNDKFIHLTGTATTKETLEDKEFGVSAAQAIHLFRKVEMYQWKEKKESKKQKKLGGGEETKTTYTYSKDWSEQPIDTSTFNEKGKEAKETELKTKMVNPAMPSKSETFTAKKVTLGAFTLPSALVSKIDKKEPLPISGSAAAEGSKTPEGFKASDKGLYKGEKPDAPAIGDVRVNFSVTKPTEVSVYGKQAGNALEPYKTKAGKSLMELRLGKMSGTEMIEAAQSENVMMTWILRLVGFLMMAVGIFLVFRPLVVVADVVPFIGDLLGAGAGVVAAIIALPLTLITIAVCWVAVRPVLGISLLAISALLLGGGIYLARKRRAAKAQTGPAVG